MRETGQKGAEDGEGKEAYAWADREFAAADRGGSCERQDDPGGVPGGGITEQTYYRWRKEYGGLQVDQAQRLKELEQETAKLKRLVSELSLEKLALKPEQKRRWKKLHRHCYQGVQPVLFHPRERGTLFRSNRLLQPREDTSDHQRSHGPCGPPLRCSSLFQYDMTSLALSKLWEREQLRT
jgi:Transposase